MIHLYIILYLNTLVWLLIPFRQFRTRFFGYFLVLGLMDPIYLILVKFDSVESSIYYSFITILLLYPTLFSIGKRTKSMLILFFLGLVILFILQFIEQILITQLLMHLVVLLFFIKHSILYLSQNKSLLLFHLVLIVYEFSIILKFFVPLGNIEMGPEYFYFTTAIQIFIGIYFLFYNETNSIKINV